MEYLGAEYQLPQFGHLAVGAIHVHTHSLAIASNSERHSESSMSFHTKS